MKDRRDKTVTYYCAKFSGSEKKNLQERLKFLLKIEEKNRMFSPTAESEDRIFLINSATQDGTLVATLVKYEKGRHQHLVVPPQEGLAKGSMKSAEVGESEEGHDREVVEGDLYLSVVGNELAVVQSVVLKTKALEEHLSWLMGEHDNDFSEGDTVLLERKVTQNTEEVLKKHPVKDIHLEGGLRSFVNNDKSLKNDIPKGKKTIIHPGLFNLSYFKEALKKDDKIKDLFEQHGMENVDVEVIFKVPKRKAEASKEVMKDLVRALGEETFEKMEFDTVGGPRMKGGEFFEQGKLRVDYFSGVISWKSVYQELAKWLVETAKRV